MEEAVVCRNSRIRVKTDLSLLLECLKFQMKCPDLQKQALLTLHSICEKKEDNVDLLREMGGVDFLYKLSKSSIVHSDVQQTALFTLGTLAEANVYCKNSLCRKETFGDLAGWLNKEDIPLTQKRVSVYLLSVLVANNKSGQTLAQITGCLDALLDLFRSTFPLSTEIVANATHASQLWASVCNALCGCVNNPQNEEGQHICVAAFPIIKIWLQQIALPHTEIFQSVCSFIAMTVANNSRVQESFCVTGGLETLTLSLVRLASVADMSLLACELSVTISKTLSACISDNPTLASGMAQYGIVTHLVSLLDCPNLDPENRLSVLLTLCHCTEASEDHQSQLVQCGGLPLIITLLIDDKSEEVRKAATFILQTCKQATTALEVSGLIPRQGEVEKRDFYTDMESFRSSAKELLHRIELLEKKKAKETEDERESNNPMTSTEGLVLPSLSPALLQQKESEKSFSSAYGQASTHKLTEAESDNSIRLQTDRGSKCNITAVLMSSHVQSLEGGREPHAAQTDSQCFKAPAPMWHNVSKQMRCNEKELQNQKTVEEHTLAPSRCAACVLPFEKFTSRTFAALQKSCRHSCDMHRALQAATEKFRARHCSLLFRAEYNQDNSVEVTGQNTESVSAAEPHSSKKNCDVKEVSLTPIREGAGKGKSSLPGHSWKERYGITFTPLHRAAKKQTFTLPNKTERRGMNNIGNRVLDDELQTSSDRCSTRRKRKDFSVEEVHFLLSGVKKFGFSWNSILWSYPFQPGRTNVSLAKKYRQLMVTKRKEKKNLEIRW